MKMNSLTSKQTVERLNAIKDGATVRVEFMRGSYRLVAVKGEFIPSKDLDGAWGVRVIGADGDLAGYVFIPECEHVSITKDSRISVHLPGYGKQDRTPITKRAVRKLKERPIMKRLDWQCGKEPPKIGEGETMIVVAGENESVSEIRKRLRMAMDTCEAVGGKFILDATRARDDVRRVYGNVPQPLTADERIKARLDNVICKATRKAK